MNIELAVDPGSVLRVFRKEYQKLDSRFGGYNASMFLDAVKALNADVKLLIQAASDNELSVGKVVEKEYDGKRAVIFEGNSYKFILRHIDETERLMVVAIFEKSAL